MYPKSEILRNLRLPLSAAIFLSSMLPREWNFKRSESGLCNFACAMTCGHTSGMSKFWAPLVNYIESINSSPAFLLIQFQLIDILTMSIRQFFLTLRW